MSPVAAAVTPMSWCQCELPACLPVSIVRFRQLSGTPILIPTFAQTKAVGMGRLGPLGATCSKPPAEALEAAFYHYPLIRDSR